jgi:transcriptional antiterminator NusG
VVIVDGPFKELDGKVGEVDEARGKVKVLVAMFGRETPVELDFLQIKKTNIRYYQSPIWLKK